MKWQQRRDIVSAAFSQPEAETGVQSPEGLQIITGSSIHGLVKLFICLSKATRGAGSQTSTDNSLTENSSHLIPRQVWDVVRVDI
jgi:hypothetical protein